MNHPKCPRCGKDGYPSERTARLASRTMNNRLRVYRCGGYFHVTDHEKGDATMVDHKRKRPQRER